MTRRQTNDCHVCPHTDGLKIAPGFAARNKLFLDIMFYTNVYSLVNIKAKKFNYSFRAKSPTMSYQVKILNTYLFTQRRQQHA